MQHFYSRIPGWFGFWDAYQRIVADLPAKKPTSIVEIGAWKGRSTAYLAVEVINSGKPITIHVVDTFRGSDEEEHRNDPDLARLREVFDANLAPAREVLGDRFQVIQAPSQKAAKLFAKDSVDAVWIDAEHTEAAVHGDIMAWWGPLKKGGWVGGDDLQWPGVYAAVARCFPTIEMGNLKCMKILLIDIETAPNTVYVWGLYKPIIGLNQIVRTGRVMCFATKWLDDPFVGFRSEVGSKRAHKDMIKAAHTLLDTADVVVHYNGSTFDVPTLNREFLKLGLTPPSPYHQVDLLKVARKQFRFASNKLDHLLKELDLKGKVDHRGFELWVDCMNGDPEAWKEMEEYNRGDIEGLEPLYRKMLPWITNHPNAALYGSFGAFMCTNCGSGKLQKRGYKRTRVAVYRQLQCQDCGTWLRERQTDLLPEERKNVLVQS